MHSVVLYPVLLFLILPFITAALSNLQKRQDCGDGYSQCNPVGATSTSVPAIGTDMFSLLPNLVSSVAGISAKRSNSYQELHMVLGRSQSSSGVCCTDGTDCLLLKGYNTPFCYDKFTTNFFLPDGSFGTIDDGNYTATDGSIANLLTGQYTLRNGTIGDIYESGDVPNTSTLALPTPFTSAGVGSAIPASALGALATFTITVPGSTIQPTVLTPSEVFTPVVIGSTTIISSQLEPAITIPGTTIAPTTYTVTSHLPATASSTGGASTVAVLPVIEAGLGILSFLMVVMGL
ncbi:hypothetical protein MMC19_002867 [Ptychographa xylographoides]|nr:hypothetical protein [Ptychographa xylographoides]